MFLRSIDRRIALVLALVGCARPTAVAAPTTAPPPPAVATGDEGPRYVPWDAAFVAEHVRCAPLDVSRRAELEALAEAVPAGSQPRDIVVARGTREELLPGASHYDAHTIAPCPGGRVALAYRSDDRESLLPVLVDGDACGPPFPAEGRVSVTATGAGCDDPGCWWRAVIELGDRPVSLLVPRRIVVAPSGEHAVLPYVLEIEEPGRCGSL